MLFWDESVSQNTNCSGDSSWLSDGFCDFDTNNLSCAYDGGDCCACTCVNGTYACGSNEFNCLDSACPDEDPSPYADCAVRSDWLGDGFCDPEANNLACLYDGGDCCACSCVDGPLYPCGWNGFDCNDISCLDLAAAIEYPTCAGNILTIGDGLCTADNNNAPCGYDGGDCCLCTCNSSACLINEFNCTDPSAGDELFDCNLSASSVTSAPCPADGQRAWVVEDTAQARALAEGVNCSGGSFEVIWEGDVVVDKTIYVVDGTVLNITGAPGKISSMVGSSTSRLLTVVNASVRVTGISLSYGVATVGGAIAAVRSNLTLDGTTFVGNTATGHGGAIYAADSSSISFVGNVNVFYGNTAGIDGGAVFLSESSCSGGNTTFLNNTAGDDGGAVMVAERSTLSWDGSAIYRGNRAGGAGGAMCSRQGSMAFWNTVATFASNSAEGSSGAIALKRGSNATWHGEITFETNTARHFGGALHVRDDSHVSWNATTVFRGNHAGFSGGGIRLTFSSSAVWTGTTKFVENVAADGGGAIMIISGCNILFDGNTTFSVNEADATRGGAVIVSDYSVAIFDGDTAFSVNTAGRGGAVFAEFSSNLYFRSKTVFVGNVAASEEIPGSFPSGGALYVLNSTATFSGETMFTANQAMGAGGAVYIFAFAVSWTGRSSFDKNSGGDLGGAVSCFSSTVVVEGDTTFHGNTADSGGGLHIHESTVTWSGVADFKNNSAYSGGAVAAWDNSDVSWSGKITLVNNHDYGEIGGSGGGFAVFNRARVSLSGQALFANNSAHSLGGALHLAMGGTISWSGYTVFFGCIASFAGAIFIGNGSAVEWTGQTEFISNEATVSGGAVGQYISADLGVEHDSVLSINGSTLFANNTAGVTGGGYFGSGGKILLTFQSPDVLFVGNSAGVAGGAVSVSGFRKGPVFSGVKFVSNVAGTGGAAFITGSGNDGIGHTDTTSAFATKFDGCQFSSNRATATGGAIESVAGQDYISNTVFIGNTAGVGGALRLAGTVGLDNCSFVDNQSNEDEGPAVDNIGVLSVIQKCSFIGNVFNCQPGTYLDFNVSGDVFDVACDGCGAPCQECTFEEPPLGVPICIETMDHTTSSGGATTIRTVSIDPGFWRATSTTRDVFACYRDEACLGGVTATHAYCRNGYEGPYCSICSEGYGASFGFSCDKCSDKASGIVVAVVFVAVLLLGAAAVASYTMSSIGVSGGRGAIERLTRFIPLPSIKIAIVALQIVTQFTAIANVTYPQVYQRFLDAVNVINFDLGWISQLSMGCLFDIGIHGRLLIATIGPIIAAMFLSFTYIVATRGIDRGVSQFSDPINRNSGGSLQDLRMVRHRHVSMGLLLTFLIYSSVSSVVFQMFACDDLADGHKYLRADYRVDCESPTHSAFQIYAGFMIVVYPVGIPTLYAFLLFRNRGVLKDEVGREANQRTQAVSDLWMPYKPSVFYYEVIECVRRVLLTGVVVFIYPNTSAQIAVTLIIAFAFAITSEGLAPFASKWDTWISRMGHVVVYASMYVALLLKVDVSDEKSGSQKVFEAVLVAAHVGMVLAVIAESGVMMCSLKETVREISSPKLGGTVIPVTISVEPLAET
eukprot:jgi/Undpi1/12902/HiC_scaffold_7.g02568.m1